MTPEARQRLREVVEACGLVATYAAGLDFDAYARNRLVRDAVERRTAVVGEALNQAAALEPGLAGRFPELRQIVALRNRLIHAYFAIDNAIVWDVIQRRLPPLESRIAAMLREGDFQ